MMDDAIVETARLHRWAQRVNSATEERVLLPSPSIFTARQHGGAHFVPIAEDNQTLDLQVKMIVEIARAVSNFVLKRRQEFCEVIRRLGRVL